MFKKGTNPKKSQIHGTFTCCCYWCREGSGAVTIEPGLLITNPLGRYSINKHAPLGGPRGGFL